MNTFKPDFVRCSAAPTFVVLAAISFLLFASLARATTPVAQMAPQGPAACQPSWVPTFGEAPGTNGSVLAAVAFDDGSGPALYAGGNFTFAGSAAANHVAKWNGSRWSALGGIDGPVVALTVFDDGNGPALYAGGYFTTAGGLAANYIAKWDGSTWSALGSGMSQNGAVRALTVFDDGSGPALYAGGDFATAGGVQAIGIAKWNGSSWSALGSGMDNAVSDLTVFDDGFGPALYASGEFTSAGGLATTGIAMWDGSSWSAPGGGMNGYAYALTVFDDGSGPALFVGGTFTTAGGGSAKCMAKWNGSSWSAVGSGMPPSSAVLALTVFDDGTGPALYAGGHFTSAGGVAANHIAKWNGSSWSAPGGGVNDYVYALAVFDAGSGAALYAGGSFATAGGVAAKYIARWNGSSWSALGSGMDGVVLALTAFDDGNGPALYAGGAFTTAGGVAATYIARWNGSSWSTLGSGMNNFVRALTVFDDGSGPALYVGGDFTTAGGVAAKSIARWNGSIWSTVGGGMSQYSQVFALTVYDDGSGPALYAGGAFGTAGGAAANIAKWNGSSWSALGTGLAGEVHALMAFDDGSGSALYAGGRFLNAGNYIAKWNGSSWSALGSGMPSSQYTDVNALAVFDDGSGPALYAGGNFTSAGSAAAIGIAEWNGSVWSTVGSGMAPYGHVSALTVFDDGSGRALYAGGFFDTAGGISAQYIAKWNGSIWSTLGSGMSWNCTVYSLTEFDDSSGPALYAGGSFASALDSGDSYLAKWGCPFVGSGTTYCTAGTTSNGCVPRISGTGSASATASSGFTISVSGVDGQRWGLLFYGISGPLASPWGSGDTSRLCVKSPTQRMSAQNSGGNFGTCTGALGEDWNTYVAGHPGALGQTFSGGETVWAQACFRDPPAPKTTNLSDGLVFSVGP